MEKVATTIIIIGSVLWCFSVLFMEGRWRPQMISAAILILGIFVAHIWEEVFRKES